MTNQKNSPRLRLAHRRGWGGEGDTGGAQDVSGCAYLYFAAAHSLDAKRYNLEYNDTMSAKDLVIYQTDAGAIELPVDIAAETIWATRMQIAALFDVTPQNITMHLKSIYGSSEMDREATSKDSLLVQTEGGSYG